jgi:DNA-binding transcriptional LysR family regulator
MTQSDMGAIMARHIGEEFRRSHAVQLIELPLQPARLRCSLVWHNRLRDHPAHRWMRGIIQSVANEVQRC